MERQEEKVYKKKWFAIIMLLFFAPIGILLIWTNKHFERKTNTVLSIVFGLWFIFILISAQPTEEEKAAEQEKQEQREKEQQVKEEKAQKEKEEAEKRKQEEQEKEEKEKAIDKAEKEWSDYRRKLLDHYGEANIIDLKAVDGFDIIYAYVPNEFKLSSEDERRYYVEEIGPLLEEDLGSHFHNDSIWIEFKYADGNNMATRKMLGGWKIR